MPLSNQILAYTDCIDKFELALSRPQGIRIRFPNKGRAHFFMVRMHQARSLDRQQNKRLYEKSHLMWGNSPFDQLEVSMPAEDTEGFFWITVQRRAWEIDCIEDLTTQEEFPNETPAITRSPDPSEPRRIGFASGDGQHKGDGELPE